jgi:ankyrin repeat protein
MTFDEAQTFIKKGDVISLRQALDAGMLPDLSNQFSWTVLMLTAIEGNTTIAELLIERGADKNKANDFGDTALSLAACGGHAQLVKVLLNHGASAECRPHGTTLDSWLRVSSGLPQEKIRQVLDLISRKEKVP